jgi:hypothetical protein
MPERGERPGFLRDQWTDAFNCCVSTYTACHKPWKLIGK